MPPIVPYVDSSTDDESEDEEININDDLGHTGEDMDQAEEDSHQDTNSDSEPEDDLDQIDNPEEFEQDKSEDERDQVKNSRKRPATTKNVRTRREINATGNNDNVGRRRKRGSK